MLLNKFFFVMPMEQRVETPSVSNTVVEVVEKESKDDADIALNRVKKPIKVKVDGNTYEVDRTPSEGQLDKGDKVVITETEDLTLNIDMSQKPRIKKGFYVDKNITDKHIRFGARLSYQSENNDIDLKYDPFHKEGSLTYTKWF